jgi:hypothetical protein
MASSGRPSLTEYNSLCWARTSSKCAGCTYIKVVDLNEVVGAVSSPKHVECQPDQYPNDVQVGPCERTANER